MRPGRRIAVMLDADQLDFREEATLRGIARFADAAGWRLVLDPFAVHDPPADCCGILAPPRRYAGPCIRRAPVPVVCFAWSRKSLGTARVLDNRYEAGRLAARHLVHQGYHTFAYLGFSRQAQSCIERTDFTRQLRKLGRRVHRVRTFASYTRERHWWRQLKTALDGWLPRLTPPVGVLAARPGLARALADRALAQGLRIPHDIGILAADDLPAVCEPSPALSSIRFDYEQLGHRAAALLHGLLDGTPAPERAILLPPPLVPRHSTDRLAVGDPLVAQALWHIDTHCTDRLDWRAMDGRRTGRIGPRDVATALGIGERTLQRHLRAAGRDTILGELTKARVAYARIQLEHSNSPLPAVAHESGFATYQAMARAFRGHLGVPPSHFRRNAPQEAQS